MLSLVCPICEKRTDDFFIYSMGYIVCSYECEEEVRGFFKDTSKTDFPPLNLPKLLCTNCYQEIDDTPYIKHGNKYCNDLCYKDWLKVNGYDQIISL